MKNTTFLYILVTIGILLLAHGIDPKRNQSVDFGYNQLVTELRK